MTRNVVRPARASVPMVVPRSASLKKPAIPPGDGVAGVAVVALMRVGSSLVCASLPARARTRGPLPGRTPGRPPARSPALPYSSVPSRPRSSIWTNPLVSNSSWRGAIGDVSSSAFRGHELDDHALVALHEGVDEELVGARLELEVLEGVHVDGDRDRREVRRDLGLLGDDALHPARPVRDQLSQPVEPVRDGLLEDRAQEVLDVGPARHEALVDEELRGRIARHVGSNLTARGVGGAARRAAFPGTARPAHPSRPAGRPGCEVARSAGVSARRGCRSRSPPPRRGSRGPRSSPTPRPDERPERVHRPRRAAVRVEQPVRGDVDVDADVHAPRPRDPRRHERGEERVRRRRLVGPGREQHVARGPGAGVGLDPQAVGHRLDGPDARRADRQRPGRPAMPRSPGRRRPRSGTGGSPTRGGARSTNRRRVGSSRVSHSSRLIGRSESSALPPAGGIRPDARHRLRERVRERGELRGREHRRRGPGTPRVLVAARQLPVAGHRDHPSGAPAADHGRGQVHRRVPGSDDQHGLAAASPPRARHRPTGRARTAGRRSPRRRAGTPGSPGSSLPVATTTASAASDPPPCERDRRSGRPARRRRSPSPATGRARTPRATRRAPRRAACRGTARTWRGPGTRRRARRPSARSGRGPRRGRSSSRPAR